MLLTRVAFALAMILAVPGGCVTEPLRMGHLEVWNQTMAPIRITATDATEVLLVAACGHAVAEPFPIGHFTVHYGTGQLIALLGGGGPDSTNAGGFYVVLTDKGVDHASAEQPVQ